MSDGGGLWAMGAVSQHERQERRRTAADQFRESQDRAETMGMQLRRCSESHYQLRAGKMLWNIYPGNRRLVGVRETGTPFVQLKDDWNLLDVVDSIGTTLKTWKEERERARQKGSAPTADPETTSEGLAEA